MDVPDLDERCFWLLEAAPDATLIVDAAGRIFFANRHVEELFGYQNEELRGQAIECLIPQRFRQEFSAHRQKYNVRPDRRPMGSGLPLFGQRKDGSEIALDIGLSPLETSAGAMTIATLRDMTWRKNAAEELRQKAYLEQVVASVNDVVWSISATGDRVLFVNPAWEWVFGHSRSEAQNNPGLWLKTIHPDDRALAQASLAILLADGQWDQEYRILRPDGEVRWISDHAVLVRDAQGRPLRIDGIGRDITRRKLAEESQAILVHELQGANEELKNFAYVVSHDLKAPLRAIGSLAEWVATDYADKFDEEGREHLRLLVGRVRRMNALIDGILQYSRVGQAHEERTDVDLDALMHGVIDSLVPPPHIRITIDTSLPTVRVERTRLQQVFLNLLSNAIKYIDKPQGEIHVGCIDQGETWKFYVRDNGPGIEERHFERIFQLFQTLMPRDRVESTGVGLALVKKIIEMHDGHVWLESRIGEGSTFFFTLPRVSVKRMEKANAD